VNLHVLHFLHPILTVSALRGHKSYGTCTEPAPALAPSEVLCDALYVYPHLCRFNIVPGRGTNETRHVLPKTRHVFPETWRVIEKCRVQEVQEVQVLFLLRYYTEITGTVSPLIHLVFNRAHGALFYHKDSYFFCHLKNNP